MIIYPQWTVYKKSLKNTTIANYKRQIAVTAYLKTTVRFTVSSPRTAVQLVHTAHAKTLVNWLSKEVHGDLKAQRV